MKKLLACTLALAIIVCLAFTGCSSNPNPSSSTPAPASSESASQAQTDTSSEAEPNVPKGDPVEIKMISFTWSQPPTDLEKVVNKFNEEYAIPLLNEKLSLEVYAVGNWAQQLNMKLTSGEDFDLFPAFMMNAAQMYAAHQIQPLTEAVKNNGSYLMSALPEAYWTGCSMDGEYIGIPNINRCMGSAAAITYRKDIAEKYGFEPDRFTDVEYLEECLMTVKEKETSIKYPIATNELGGYLGGVSEHHYSSPDAWVIGAGYVVEESDDYQLVDYFETDDFKNIVTTARRWNQAGLTMPNASIAASDEIQDYFRQGLAFCFTGREYPESVASKPASFPGLDVGVAYLDYPFVGTGDYQVFAMCVPTASKKVNEAVKMMNLLYENIDAFNLLAYGIEGEHYVKTGKDDREIRYPDGLDAMSVGYSGGALSSSIGRVYDGFYLEGTPSDLGDQVAAFEKLCPPSKILGFYFNSESVTTEMALIQAAYDQYYKDLICGDLDPETGVKAFNDALEQAGQEKVTAEHQRQLDEWVAAKK